MERKNRKIDLFGTPINIVYKNISAVNEDGSVTFGYYDHLNHIIVINCLDNNGKLLSEDEILLTLLHELTHAILSAGCYSEQDRDEPLVEFIARSLKSLIKQKVI